MKLVVSKDGTMELPAEFKKIHEELWDKIGYTNVQPVMEAILGISRNPPPQTTPQTTCEKGGLTRGEYKCGVINKNFGIKRWADLIGKDMTVDFEKYIKMASENKDNLTIKDIEDVIEAEIEQVETYGAKHADIKNSKFTDGPWVIDYFKIVNLLNSMKESFGL